MIPVRVMSEQILTLKEGVSFHHLHYVARRDTVKQLSLRLLDSKTMFHDTYASGQKSLEEKKRNGQDNLDA